YLVETKAGRFLVDCGMVQGSREAMARNREPFAFDVGTIDFVLLTHAHIDHSGLLPKLARDLVEWHDEGTDLPYLHFTASVDESKALNQIRSGAIIISASGMCNAGRIRHHLRNNLARPQCSILITGYQAEGTLGRRLVDGAPVVRIFGDEIPVNASVHTLNGFSAHADQAALLEWTSYFKTAPKQVFVVHGEAKAAKEFSGLLKNRYGWKTLVPEHGQTVTWNPQTQRLES
ncbi:MAG TPA: MBL fold metallo-hydrolase, partial [Rhodobacteraceae bacterium]|nr:MBL fold metallo-hydrolase [Paracoccaceae bacterium]